MLIIEFDICNDAHVMSDSGWENIQNPGGVRVHNNNAECYARADGRPCRRRGRCVIARDKSTWKQVTTKTWGLADGK